MGIVCLYLYKHYICYTLFLTYEFIADLSKRHTAPLIRTLTSVCHGIEAALVCCEELATKPEADRGLDRNWKFIGGAVAVSFPNKSTYPHSLLAG